MPEVHSTFEPHRERPRNRTMTRMEVVNRNTLNLVLPDGQVVQPGTSQILVYEDNVAVVEAQVETNPAALEEAHRRFALTVAEQLASRLGGRWAERSAEENADLIKRGDLTEKERAALDEVRARTGASPEGEFHTANRRGVKPLVSAKVIEKDIPEPQRALQVAESTRQAEILATAMKRAWGEGPAPQQPKKN